MDMSQYLKNPIQLDEVCRMCLCKKDAMKPIFEACLGEMVTYFTNLDIKKGDGLPELICRQCVLAISRAYSFKKMCEKNANILKLFVSKEFQDELAAIKKQEVSQAAASKEYPTCSETQECVSVIHMASTTDMNSITIKCGVPSPPGIPNMHVEIPIEYVAPMSPSDHCDDLMIDPQEEVIIDYNNPNPIKYNCLKCKQSFDLEVDYKLHMLLHPLDRMCQTCGKVFTGTHAYKRHLKTHLLIKPHVCDICSKSFADSSNLQKHKKKHTGELRNVIGKPHLCSVCGRGFKWATSLSKHTKYHTGRKLLTCKYCPRQYVEPRSLLVHMRGHTGERPYKCKLCERSFTQQCNLQKHLRTHTGERPYECDRCGKGFSQKGYIQIHLRTHTGERPYVCSECGKGFTGANALVTHKRIHTGEKPFQCALCDKQFTRQESLAIHQRCHSGERPHKCTLCNKGFNNTGHLQSHMRSHTGEKPYSCTMCDKRFATNGSLKVHLRMHTGEKPYLCGVCGKSFSQSSTLATHMNIHVDKGQSSTDTILQQQQTETQEVQIVVHPEGLVKVEGDVSQQPHILVDPSKPHIAVLDKGHITLVDEADKQISEDITKQQHIMIMDNEVPTSSITWCIMKNVSS